MATQADATSPEISAELVGNAFVPQFYEILHHSPEHVHKFYNDQSMMNRPDRTGKLVTATSMDNIKDLIHSFDWANYNIEILTVDTQASYEKGVTVLVTGCLTGQDVVRWKFVESFFLAPQTVGYFVLNNTFRFIDEVPVKDLVEEHCNEIAPSAPISPMSAVALLQEVAEIPDDSLGNHTGVMVDIEETTEVPVNQQILSSMGKVVPQSSTDSSHNVQPGVKASSNGNVDTPKKSYASLLMNAKQGTSVLLDHKALAKPVKQNIAPKYVRPGGQQTQAATLPTVATSAAATEFSASKGNNGNASGNGHASSNGHVAGKGFSIYIGHLPFDATPKLVEQEFKKFGCIKKNGIQVRSNRGYVFGFVEYEDASAQENALKMRTIQIGDREVQIEEKKTDARADYTAGRGGYRNSGYRRGNYSNGRGYARNDDEKRSGEGQPRGRGNGNGYVNENDGGRGSRQSGGPK